MKGEGGGGRGGGGGGGAEYPEKTPDDDLQKMPHSLSPKIQAPTETRTRTPASVAGYKSRRANHCTTRRPWVKGS